MIEIQVQAVNPEISYNIPDLLSLNGFPTKKGLKEKRSYQRAESKIEPYLNKGRVYYRYRRGRDRPIHLGDADHILWLVKRIEPKKGKHIGRPRKK